ncbi:GH1 family beta-glucosidase [Tessaracoccus sp. MC1756]|uniref:GH1 family beta-glucosidase n=1 Tax=Tessaracoccus sp. MC1756 TaxID=2760311 RepID=UPI0016029182|nr:GH1 family beta-glucosidase [Tessaracoccus sp. MC1756]MBB1508669.1 beta-glucosidase [Tessaracoccus sp. MC1756]
MTPVTFTPDFIFGAATAAFQIEGANTEDGRVPSIWDTFCATPGKVVGGDTGEVACDHYHRMPQDVALMKELGLQAYRFSTAWPRVVPAPGEVNQKGLDFYSRLVDELLADGIKPWLTLYHWDLPQYEQDRGGWTNRDTAHRFADYAEVMYRALGDRVDIWTTLNEPWCSAFLGYANGEHAPGHQDGREALAAAHHLLLGHGLAVTRLRELGLAQPKQVGITINPSIHHPADPDSAADRDAARRHDALRNRIWLDPLFTAEYPADLIADMGDLWPAELILDGDLEIISQPIDVLGINFYNGETTAAVPGADVDSPGSPHPRTGDTTGVGRDVPLTAMGWEVYAPDFTDVLVRLSRDWAAPHGAYLVVTENGAAFNDVPDAEGFVADADRSDYLYQHIGAVHDAIEAGADVRGYLAWSLLDNFEWAWGYEKRFGIVHVDYDTQVRTPKASARWYADVIRSRELAKP